MFFLAGVSAFNYDDNSISGFTYNDPDYTLTNVSYIVNGTTFNQTDADALYVKIAGDTMTGGLTVDDSVNITGNLYFDSAYHIIMNGPGSDPYHVFDNNDFFRYDLDEDEYSIAIDGIDDEDFKLNETRAWFDNDLNVDEQITLGDNLTMYKTGSQPWFRFGYDPTWNWAITRVASDGALDFINHHGSADETRMSIDPTGDVSIGDGFRSALGKLHVYGGGRNIVMQDGIVDIYNTDGGNDARIAFRMNTSGINSAGWIGIPWWNQDALYIYSPKNGESGSEAGYIATEDYILLNTNGANRLKLDTSYVTSYMDARMGWFGDQDTIKFTSQQFMPTSPDVNNCDYSTQYNYLQCAGASDDVSVDVFIPVGYKATHVMVYGEVFTGYEVFESNTNSYTLTSKGSANVNSAVDITDVTSSSTNFLKIVVNNMNNKKIYGGYVTIARV